ncbi:MAG: N-acetyl-gamma-glutamyl-phosphate reductase [Desulfobacterales bacterium]|jgi:N-acetyl-gamma-glutamyl-phosphate reductase|nr:N-acetyl-gamma-glutamyl-phosphate reductase [Desulfobacterales bacterium]
MIRAAIAGATGYAGAELVRILAAHPGVEIVTITSRQFAGQRFDRIFPAFAGRVELICEDLAAERIGEGAQVVFTALPHKMPMGLAPSILRRGCRLIDLSADFRFNDAAVYEAAYQPHASRELLADAVYGLSELFTDAIRGARLVGNPGCYPTSALLPLIPLLKEGLIETEAIVVDSKSGVSGAGRSPSLTVHFCEVNDSFKAYKVAAHRHAPEMETYAGRAAGRPIGITFVPHLVPMTRGMLSTIYARPAPGATARAVRQCFESFYAGRPFIRLRPDGMPPDTLHVRGTNACDIGWVHDERNRRLILMSAIDNLVKGAAGQAVQNMNLMFGLEETEGLRQMAWPV